MEFQRLTFEHGTGAVSKQIETYNFHKAAAVLAEYGFDCIRLSNDWKGADFLAHHRDSEQTLSVQLKTCLVIDEGLCGYEDLYICFPLDGTGKWYLLKHKRLVELVKEHAPQWLKTNRWKSTGGTFSYTGTKTIREALEPYSYQCKFGDFGYREVRAKKRLGAVLLAAWKAVG